MRERFRLRSARANSSYAATRYIRRSELFGTLAIYVGAFSIVIAAAMVAVLVLQ